MQIEMVFENKTAFVPAVCSTSDVNRTEVMIPRSVLEVNVRDYGMPLFNRMKSILGRRTSGWHYVNSDGEKTNEYQPGHTLHFVLHEMTAMTVESAEPVEIENAPSTQKTKNQKPKE